MRRVGALLGTMSLARRAELSSASLDPISEMPKVPSAGERARAVLSARGGVPPPSSPRASAFPPPGPRRRLRPLTCRRRALPTPRGQPRSILLLAALPPPVPLPAAPWRPHLPTPCRSLSALRQGAMTEPGPRLLPWGSRQGVAGRRRAPLPSSFQTPLRARPLLPPRGSPLPPPSRWAGAH